MIFWLIKMSIVILGKEVNKTKRVRDGGEQGVPPFDRRDLHSSLKLCETPFNL